MLKNGSIALRTLNGASQQVLHQGSEAYSQNFIVFSIGFFESEPYICNQ
jgi:hypothetical protein